MIHKFEVGEVAIMRNARYHPERNDEEVTICKTYGILRVRQKGGGITARVGYGVMTRDGVQFVVQPWQLRKKRPREALGSWDDCIWRPQQVKSSAGRRGPHRGSS